MHEYVLKNVEHTKLIYCWLFVAENIPERTNINKRMASLNVYFLQSTKWIYSIDIAWCLARTWTKITPGINPRLNYEQLHWLHLSLMWIFKLKSAVFTVRKYIRYLYTNLSPPSSRTSTSSVDRFDAQADSVCSSCRGAPAQYRTTSSSHKPSAAATWFWQTKHASIPGYYYYTFLLSYHYNTGNNQG